MPRADRERLILDVAGSVFAQGGYHSASMDEIAALAEVSKPMLYAYFGSKEGLYVAYIHRTGRELLDRLVAAAGPDDSPTGRLRARVGEFLAFVEQYRDGWTLLFREMTSSRPLADEVAQLRGQIAGAVQRMIEDPISRAGGLDAPASEAIAHAIVGAGESLANWWLSHPETPREDVVEWYVEVVQAAVSARLRKGAAARGG